MSVLHSRNVFGNNTEAVFKTVRKGDCGSGERVINQRHLLKEEDSVVVPACEITPSHLLIIPYYHLDQSVWFLLGRE